MDIHEHGTWVRNGTRVQCNYCHKRMTNFYRLKFHLGNVRKDVTLCDEVPFSVRRAFFKMVMKLKSVRMRGLSQDSSSKTVALENGNIAVEAGKRQMFVARFFYEHCVDFSAVDSTSFKQMMMAAGGRRMRLEIPHSPDLNGWMLQQALMEVQDSVKKIKDSWAVTGCSILLDTWIDQKGHSLVSFVADGPAGAVYLKSLDVSDIKNDVTALTWLVNGLVEEVGTRNVTQMIASSTSGWDGNLGKLLAGHGREVFWSVSVSHCFELLLVKIGKMYSFGDVLDKVNTIWEFINNNPSLLKVFSDHSHGVDVTPSSSEFEFVTPYLTLESIFKAKMAAMFASPDWKKEEGITVSCFVNDSSFWETVERVVKCTSPVIHGLLLLSTVEDNHVGYIFDILVRIKESIALNFNHEKQLYMSLLEVIDDVWNNHLGNPLHAAGYFLNPDAYYSDQFHLDQEVITGLSLSLDHVVKEVDLRVKIAKQFEMYRRGEYCYSEASQADEVFGISPVEWWIGNGSQHPELQSFAIKILRQTCEGASKYKLKRNLAEKLLLTEGMSHSEKQHLEELAFVHYNLHLQSCKAKVSE